MMQREMHTLESIETVCNEVGTYIKQSTTFKEQIHEHWINIDVGSCCKHVVYFPIHLEHILGQTSSLIPVTYLTYCCQTFSMEHPKN